MKTRTILMVVVLVAALALAACNKAESTTAAAAAPEDGGARPRDGGLVGVNRLVLGTFRLEGTEHAVRPAQAAEMLPLWQVIQSGSLQGAAETDAVLKQIEGVMDEAQVAAIEGMELSFQDMQAWMESPSAKALGIEMPAPPEGVEGRPGGGGGLFQDMTEEERTQLRQEMQNMTDEQRATRMAEMGIERPEGGGPGGGGFGGGARPGGGAGGGGNVLLEPLIELLSVRAAE